MRGKQTVNGAQGGAVDLDECDEWKDNDGPVTADDARLALARELGVPAQLRTARTSKRGKDWLYMEQQRFEDGDEGDGEADDEDDEGEAQATENDKQKDQSVAGVNEGTPVRAEREQHPRVCWRLTLPHKPNSIASMHQPVVCVADTSPDIRVFPVR